MPQFLSTPAEIAALPEDALIVSHSQLGVWDRCEYKWYLSYIERFVPKKRNRNAAKGIVIHDLLHVFYKAKKEKPGQHPDYYYEVVHEHAKKLLAESYTYEEMQALATCLWVVERYIKEYAPTEDKKFVVLETEKFFYAELTTPVGRKYYLICYIDLVTGAVGVKTVDIWDHKSSEQKFWTPAEAALDSQLPSYAAIMRHLGYSVKNVWINGLKTYDYKDKTKVKLEQLFRRERSYRTDIELDNFLVELGREVDEIADAQESHAQGTWQPRRSLNRDCSRCQFQEVCLYALKGRDKSPILAMNFDRRPSRKEAKEEKKELDASLETE